MIPLLSAGPRFFSGGHLGVIILPSSQSCQHRAPEAGTDGQAGCPPSALRDSPFASQDPQDFTLITAGLFLKLFIFFHKRTRRVWWFNKTKFSQLCSAVRLTTSNSVETTFITTSGLIGDPPALLFTSCCRAGLALLEPRAESLLCCQPQLCAHQSSRKRELHKAFPERARGVVVGL